MITTFVGLVICGLVDGGLAAVANQVIRTLSAERAAGVDGARQRARRGDLGLDREEASAMKLDPLLLRRTRTKEGKHE